MSETTRDLDLGLIEWLTSRLLRLNSAQISSLASTLQHTYVDQGVNPSGRLGSYEPKYRAIRISSASHKFGRVLLVHELAHALDHLEKPGLYSTWHPFRTLRLEWRAKAAEEEYLNLSLSIRKQRSELRLAVLNLEEVESRAASLPPAYKMVNGRFTGIDFSKVTGLDQERILDDASNHQWFSHMRSHLRSSKVGRKVDHLRSYTGQVYRDLADHPLSIPVLLAIPSCVAWLWFN